MFFVSVMPTFDLLFILHMIISPLKHAIPECIHNIRSTDDQALAYIVSSSKL